MSAASMPSTSTTTDTSTPLPKPARDALRVLTDAVSRRRRAPPAALERLMKAVSIAAAAFEAECEDDAAAAEDGQSLAIASNTGWPTIESLPIEVIARLIGLAAAESGTQSCSESWRVVSRAGAVSTTMRLGAERAWHELALSLFPPGQLPAPPRPAWLGFTPPRDWRSCLSRLATSLRDERPTWRALRADGSVAPTDLPAELPHAAFLPRKVFAHSTCVHAGTLYVFGGRHLSTHSDTLNALDLNERPLTWRALEASGTPPRPRRQHTAVLDAAGRMHVVGGGFLEPSGERVYWADHHALDMASLTWQAMPAPPAGWACMAHTCVYVMRQRARRAAQRRERRKRSKRRERIVE